MTAPTDQIPDDVLDIAGVVLGGDPIPLDKPAQRLALQAMNALGYSSTYMGEVLGVSARGAASMASALRISLTRNREFVDHVAVEFVLAGTPMALRGNDFDAALLRLAGRGTTAGQCARLLRSSVKNVRQRAEALELTLAKDRDGSCWWHRYYEDSRTGSEDKNR